MHSARTQALRVVRLFVASPSDVGDERLQLAQVVEEFNRVLGKHHGIHVEILRWETHASPGLGRAEDVVLDSLGEFDLMIGIMWSRFGTPTGKAGSGTEEEFHLAYERWTKGRVADILFYFCDAPAPYPKSPNETEQLQAVLRFKAEIQALGLVWEYSDRARFKDIVRPQLTDVLIKRFGRAVNDAAPLPEPPERIPPPHVPPQPESRSNRIVILMGVAVAVLGAILWFGHSVLPRQSAKNSDPPRAVQQRSSAEALDAARTHIANARRLLDQTEYAGAIQELNAAHKLAPLQEETELRALVLQVVNALPGTEANEWKKKIEEVEHQ
jgi:hypothetical protein